jgi:hypothetical protein
LKWLWSQDYPWDERKCTCAAEGGHLEVLKWAREHGCLWHEDTVRTPLREGTWRF